MPPETRARAFALYDVLWNTARLISLGVGGLLADRVSIRVVYVAGAALLCAAAFVGLTTPMPAHTGAGGSQDVRVRRREP